MNSLHIVVGPGCQAYGPFTTFIEAVNWIQSLKPIPLNFDVIPLSTPQDHLKELKNGCITSKS